MYVYYLSYLFFVFQDFFVLWSMEKKIRLSLLDKLQMSIIQQRYITTNGNGSKKTLVIFF